MEKYKQRKQTHNLLHIFLLTFSVFTSLFSVTGIVYCLITVGISSPLFLLCSTGFTTSAIFFTYNTYAIHSNITNRKSGEALQKEITLSINKKPEDLGGSTKNLIDFDNQLISDTARDIKQHALDVSEISKETSTPEVVKNVNLDNLTFKDPAPLTPSDNQATTTNDRQISHSLKSPSQIRGSNFAGPTRGIANQHTSSFLPILEVNAADKPKISFQLQNTNNQNVPIPPPMPIAIYDSSKVLFQPQNTSSKSRATIPITPPGVNLNYELSTTLQSQNQTVEQNNIKPYKGKVNQEQNSVASEWQAPPPPPPMPTVVNEEHPSLCQPQDYMNRSISITSPTSVAAPKVSPSDELNTIPQPQAVEQNNSNRQDDVKHYKEEPGQQPNSTASEWQALPPSPPMPEANIVDEPRTLLQSQLQDIDDFTIPTPCSQYKNNLPAIQPGRDELLKQIREIGQKNLRKTDLVRSTDTVKTSLQLALEKRAEAFATSDSMNDNNNPTPDSDWEEEVGIPVGIQKENNNKSTENYAKNNNYNGDSGISDCESSPKRLIMVVLRKRKSQAPHYTHVLLQVLKKKT